MKKDVIQGLLAAVAAIILWYILKGMILNNYNHQIKIINDKNIKLSSKYSGQTINKIENTGHDIIIYLNNDNKIYLYGYHTNE